MTTTTTFLFGCLLAAASLPAQAHLIADFEPGAAGSGTTAIATLGETAIFATVESTGGKLWASDGSAAGTTLIAVMDAVPPYTVPTLLTTVGSRVLMAWGDSTTGLELWSTDGTAAGTGLVLDINPGVFGSNPRNFGVVDGVCYFSAAATGGNYELWRSDGTAAGTWLVAEIHSSPTTGSDPSGFTKLGSSGSFLFAATDATSGRELWISDGTAAGTALVADILPGPGSTASSKPVSLVSFGELVAFTTQKPFTADNALWISDGTAAGTIAITADGVNPRYLAVHDDLLYFRGKDAVFGEELWRSDGTAGGTALFADIYAVGALGSSPGYLTPVGTRWLFFAAFTALGTELWRTDGSTVELFQDLRTGSLSSTPTANDHLTNPAFAVTPAGKVFFVANDGVHGAEPWVFDTGVVAATASYGLPCGGLALHASSPYVDSTVWLTTSFIPATSPLSVNFLSLTKVNPALELTFFGMPGCYLHCGLDVMTPFVGTGSVAIPFVIPDDPTWLGVEIHGQTASFVPGVNPFEAISSNGITLRVGDL